MKLQDLFESKEDYIAKVQGQKLLQRFRVDRTGYSRYNIDKHKFFYNNPKNILTAMMAQFKQVNGEAITEKYLQWIVNQYIAGKFLWEDLYKIPGELTAFDRLKNTKVWGDYSKDINQFQWDTLVAAVHFAKEKESNDPELAKSKRALAQTQIDKMKSDGELQLFKKGDGITVYIPHTKDAACYLGRGTKWCTAATGLDSYNAFKDYENDGTLYVLIMDDGRKYQFHFETKQFMDELDAPIDTHNFVREHPILEDWFGVIAWDALGEHWETERYEPNMFIVNDALLAFINPAKLPSGIAKQFVKQYGYYTQYNKELQNSSWDNHGQ